MGRLRILLLCLILLVVTLPAPVQADASAPETLSLRVQTPAYEIDARGIRVPGYGRDDRPGAPALPVWSTLVELPPEGEWQVSYRSAGARWLEGAPDIPAVPWPDLAPPGPSGWAAVTDPPTFVPTVDRPDPAIYGRDGLYPEAPVQPGEAQRQRGRRLLPIRVFPFQYNPVTRRVLYRPDIVITLRMVAGTPEAQPETWAGPEGHAASQAFAAGSAGALRVRTGERGLYRLTYDDLLAAGVPLGDTDPASFAISYLGQPVAIDLVDDGDDSFEPGELVIFYAQPYEGRYERDNVYRFSYGGAPGLRMAGRAVTPTGDEPVVTAITRTLHVEVDAEYRSDYPRPQDADHWFDMPLSPDDLAGTSTLTRTYTLPAVDPLPGGAARIRVALHGGADRPANPDKSIAITLNSHPVALHQWEGLTYYISDDVVPSAWLDGAPDRIHLTAATAQLPGIGFYSVSPDWVRISYPSQASAQGDQLYIEAMAEGAVQAVASGFSTPEVRVYELRDPDRPVRLLTTAAEPAGGGYSISFWDQALPGPSYFLSSLPALAAPAAIEPDRPSSWRTPDHQADYIAIVHRSLWDAIDPLLAHRAAEGLAVAKVDVQDIYDEWSYGRRDPEAIRSFLRYAYHCWNGADCDPDPASPPPPAPPQYVLLVGDGHYDFTGVSGTPLPNLIPPYLVRIDPWLGETAADNRYASLDGPGDYLPELALGRIPARTPADVTAAVDKIIAYERAPAGAWQERVVFVADNKFDPAGDFHALSDDVRLNWLPAAYDDSAIYYNGNYFSAAAMRTAIKAAFDGDALLLQWFGHGSRFRWGGVAGMFGTPDPPMMAANDVWPFTTAYTCWTGYFVNLYPYGDGQSLGETLLLTPQRGSVADLSPSGLHVGSALLMLNQGMTLALTRDRIRPVGDAVNRAKLYYFANAGSFHDVIDTSILFGDPALRLRMPATPPTTPALTIATGAGAAALSWPHQLDSASYEVWRGTAPYFDPAAGGGVLVTTAEAGFRGAAGPPIIFDDDGSLPGPGAVTVIGDPATNYFWLVRARNGDGVSGFSGRAGEFDFALAPGG